MDKKAPWSWFWLLLLVAMQSGSMACGVRCAAMSASASPSSAMSGMSACPAMSRAASYPSVSMQSSTGCCGNPCRQGQILHPRSPARVSSQSSSAETALRAAVWPVGNNAGSISLTPAMAGPPRLQFDPRPHRSSRISLLISNFRI